MHSKEELTKILEELQSLNKKPEKNLTKEDKETIQLIKAILNLHQGVSTFREERDRYDKSKPRGGRKTKKTRSRQTR
jgi:hypothetical protein